MKVTICGQAAAFTNRGVKVTAPRVLKELGGLVLLKLTPRIIGREWAQRGITGGEVRIEYSPKTKRLIVLTQFTASGRLSLNELNTLCEQATMEWCDGYAEGAVVRLDDGSELTIDCAPSDAGEPDIYLEP